jgi:hypothetical protein
MALRQRAEHAHIDAEHNYNRQSRESVYHFLAKNMQQDDPPLKLVDGEFSSRGEGCWPSPRAAFEMLRATPTCSRCGKSRQSCRQSNVDPAAQREALRVGCEIGRHDRKASLTAVAF